MKKYYSIIRKHQYDYLESMNIKGTILDIGGTRYSEYHKFIRGSVETVNLENANYIIDLENGLGKISKKYDVVICLNVLEHILNYKQIITDSYKLIKPGGVIFIATPFLHHIHPSPNDYYRYTDQALEAIIKNAGFIKVKVVETSGGLFSLIFQSVGDIFPIFMRIALRDIAILFDKKLCLFSLRYRRLSKKMPLGYLTIARK